MHLDGRRASVTKTLVGSLSRGRSSLVGRHVLVVVYAGTDAAVDEIALACAGSRSRRHGVRVAALLLLLRGL